MDVGGGDVAHLARAALGRQPPMLVAPLQDHEALAGREVQRVRLCRVEGVEGPVHGGGDAGPLPCPRPPSGGLGLGLPLGPGLARSLSSARGSARSPRSL